MLHILTAIKCIYMCVCVRAKLLQSCPTLCNAMDCSQASLSTGFCRYEYWNGLPCPPPGIFPTQESNPPFLTFSWMAGGFFTTTATQEAPYIYIYSMFKHKIQDTCWIDGWVPRRQCCWFPDSLKWMRIGQAREGMRPVWMLTRKWRNVHSCKEGDSYSWAKPLNISTSTGASIQKSWFKCIKQIWSFVGSYSIS